MMGKGIDGARQTVLLWLDVKKQVSRRDTCFFMFRPSAAVSPAQ